MTDAQAGAHLTYGGVGSRQLFHCFNHYIDNYHGAWFGACIAEASMHVPLPAKFVGHSNHEQQQMQTLVMGGFGMMLA